MTTVSLVHTLVLPSSQWSAARTLVLMLLRPGHAELTPLVQAWACWACAWRFGDYPLELGHAVLTQVEPGCVKGPVKNLNVDIRLPSISCQIPPSLTLSTWLAWPAFSKNPVKLTTTALPHCSSALCSQYSLLNSILQFLFSSSSISWIKFGFYPFSSCPPFSHGVVKRWA